METKFIYALQAAKVSLIKVLGNMDFEVVEVAANLNIFK